MLNTIENLMVELRRVDGDKPATHAVTKELIKALKALEHATQPGVGEFKWTATARKGLTKPATMKGANPTLIVARGDNGNVWHSDGCYAVKGEPSKRFDPCTHQELPIGAMMQIIPASTEGYEVVTVAGGTDKAPGMDAVELSNGVIVNRLYLAYVTAAIGGDVTLYSKGPGGPVLARSNGETLGLVMPIDPRFVKAVK